MNKTEIQSCIDALQVYFDSKLATLKAEFAKCDCADKVQAGGIDQEKCWHAVFPDGNCSMQPRTGEDCQSYWKDSVAKGRPAYMPECRKVTAEDIRRASKELDELPGDFPTKEEFAKALHKLGFRMKVNP